MRRDTPSASADVDGPRLIVIYNRMAVFIKYQFCIEYLFINVANMTIKI